MIQSVITIEITENVYAKFCIVYLKTIDLFGKFKTPILIQTRERSEIHVLEK